MVHGTSFAGDISDISDISDICLLRRASSTFWIEVTARCIHEWMESRVLDFSKIWQETTTLLRLS